MILAISGKAGVGKSTAAKYIEEAYGATPISFADPMKRFCEELFDWDDDQLYGPSEKRDAIDPRWGISPRRALQTLGDWGRALHPDVWAKNATVLAVDLSYKGRLVVITDLRFRNELDACRAVGARTLRITRDTCHAGGHVSETDLDGCEPLFDRVIANDGTEEDLAMAIDEWLAGQ